MNNQIELTDEQLEDVLGGASFGNNGSQTNNANAVQIPIAIVGPSANFIGTGNGNFQFGPAAFASAFSAPSQTNS